MKKKNGFGVNFARVPRPLLPRAKALVLFQDVLKGKSLQHRMEEGLADLNSQERGFALELLLGSLRYYWPLKASVSQHLKSPLKKQARWLEAVLILGAYQLWVMQVPSRAVIHSMVELVRIFGFDHFTGVTNGVLRSLDRDLNSNSAQNAENREKNALEQPRSVIKPLKIHEYLHTKQWIFEAIFQDWKPYFLDIIQAFQQQAPLFLRIDQSKVSRIEYLQLLKEADIAVNPLPESNLLTSNTLQLVESCTIAALPGYQDGYVSVQDISAQAAVQVFVQHINQDLSMDENVSTDKTGLRILDACAAPGGKTAALLDALPAAQVHAVDIEPKRVERMRENLERLGFQADGQDSNRFTIICTDLTKQHPCLDQVQAEGGYDAILLDAPCSGTGVIGRHPDIMWCRKHSDLAVLVELQRDLLARMEVLLKPGGLLMYATCSILKAENSDNIEWYLSQSKTQLTPLPLDERLGLKQAVGYQKLPLIDELGDGFYYALFRKHK